MLELKSKSHRATFSQLGAKLVAFFVDGIDGDFSRKLGDDTVHLDAYHLGNLVGEHRDNP